MTRSNPGSLSKSGSSGTLDSEMTFGMKDRVSGPKELVRRLVRAEHPIDRVYTAVAAGKVDPKVGSVIRRPASPLNFHFQNSTVDGDNFSSSVIPEFTKQPTTPYLTGRRPDLEESSGRTVHDSGESRLRARELLVQRLELAGDYSEQIQSDTDVCPPGDFHYLAPQVSTGGYGYNFQPNIDAYNRTPQTALGGKSPHELIYERRGDQIASSSTDQIHPRETPDGVPARFRQGRESLSVIRNVTIRESKRPKARTQDQDYRRRSSLNSSALRATLGQFSGNQNLGNGIRQNSGSGSPYGSTPQTSGDPGRLPFTPPIPPSMGRQWGGGSEEKLPGWNNGGLVTGGRIYDPGHPSYEINLAFEGRIARHEVTPDMLVSELSEDAAMIYHLNAPDLVLVLFGMHPRTLVPQGRLSDPPPVAPGSTVMIFNIAGMGRNHAVNYPVPPIALPVAGVVPLAGNLQLGPKFLGNFKLPKFDGVSRNWKQWDKSFVRFLSIHQLDQVIEEGFLDLLPLSSQDFASNKMVYYLLEDAIVPGSLASKYFRQAAKWNGNQAYEMLHDGYVFSGPQTMTLLLAQLANLRFNADESASGFCLRLREVFEDLEMVPGPSALLLNDTQKIGYLLSGIRQETSLQAVYVALQDKQLRGAITFEDACTDLHHRCEALRVDELLDTPVRGQVQKALVSTHAKRLNQEVSEVEMAPCLHKGCNELVKIYLPLCPLCYHGCVSGKVSEIELKDSLGVAKYNTSTQVIDYPKAVPKNRFPLPRSKRSGKEGTRKALMFQSGTTAIPLLLGQSHPSKPRGDIESGAYSSFVTFYVDSGAGQCLSSCASAFISMEACHLQVIGVAGRLMIHGQGTAIFLISVDGQDVLLRIHNCLHSFGEFNLLSVSQLKLVSGTSLTP